MINNYGGNIIKPPETQGKAVLEPAATEMITLLLILAFSFTPIALGITVWISVASLPDDVNSVATETASKQNELSELNKEQTEH